MGRYLLCTGNMTESSKNFLDLADEQLTVLQQNATTAEVATPTTETPQKSSIFSMYSPLQTQETAWNGPVVDNSMPEVFGTVPILRGEGVPMWKTWSTFFGPGAMVAVGGSVFIFVLYFLIKLLYGGQRSTVLYY